MADTSTPVAMRLAEVTTPPVRDNPLPTEYALRKEQVRRNARALDDTGVREAVETLQWYADLFGPTSRAASSLSALTGQETSDE